MEKLIKEVLTKKAARKASSLAAIVAIVAGSGTMAPWGQ